MSSFLRRLLLNRDPFYREGMTALKTRLSMSTYIKWATLLVLPACFSACSSQGVTLTPQPTASYTSPIAPQFAAIPSDNVGAANAVPALPAVGQSRPGQIFNVYYVAPNGDRGAMTVFEPTTVTGGSKYPIVIEGQGYAQVRFKSLSDPVAPTWLQLLLSNGYGVVAVDQHGFGDSTGTVDLDDPDIEGPYWMAALNWLEAKIPWLAFSPSVDGSVAKTAVFATTGGSYGGTYQHLVLGVDTRKRIHAMVPEITPHDYNTSWYRNNVTLSWWDGALVAAGVVPGKGNVELPYFQSAFNASAVSGTEDSTLQSWLGYHSADYFCNGQTFPSNGPFGAPKTPPTKFYRTNILYMQGTRDWLFPPIDAYANYMCHSQIGGDVRMWTYQFGHGTVFASAFPDLGLQFLPSNDSVDTGCGMITRDQAILAYFNQFLKGQSGAANALPQFCFSLAKGDGISVSSVLTGHSGTAYPVASASLTAGQPGAPAVVDLGAVPNVQILAGFPRFEGTVTTAGSGQPTLFFAVGVLHASNPGFGWDQLDYQVTPWTGNGTIAIDLVGAIGRLQAGDHLGLLIYGDDGRYDVSPGVPARSVVPVTVQGTLWLPLVGAAQNPKPV